MGRQAAGADRNFDDLAQRYQRNVYGSLKGDIRLAILRRDFAEYLPIAPFRSDHRQLRVLDAGGGQGPFSLELARAGHRVVLCDISREMLRLAERAYGDAGLLDRVTLLHCPVQELSRHLRPEQQRFDLVLCHALMEWLAQPEALLPVLMQHLAPGGYLSLTHYNLHSLVYKNLLRTNFKKVLKQDYGGFRGSLTPINPLYPDTVAGWLAQQPLQLLCRSGIRVFYDFILDREQREREPKAVVELELALSRREPYLSLGRYIHLLATSGADA